MAVQYYEGARKQAIAGGDALIFENGFQKLKETILGYGFDPKAVEMLELNVSAYTLAISQEEARSGAWHMYADGKPFYALIVKAPGSMMEMELDEQVPLTQRSPQQQALFLSFEIGMNILCNMGRALEVVHGVQQGQSAGGVGSVSGVMMCEYETSFRYAPRAYCETMNTLMDMRLKQLVPQPISPKPQTPKFNP